MCSNGDYTFVFYSHVIIMTIICNTAKKADDPSPTHSLSVCLSACLSLSENVLEGKMLYLEPCNHVFPIFILNTFYFIFFFFFSFSLNYTFLTLFTSNRIVFFTTLTVFFFLFYFLLIIILLLLLLLLFSIIL